MDPERRLVVVVGAGFAGLGFAIQLLQHGQGDFVVLEREARLGGVWRDNVYPGLTCDIPAHVYSYSFAQNPEWTRFFAAQPEILAYLERCADEHGVRSKIRFDERLASAIWDDARGLWMLTTTRGARIEARALVCAAGLALSRPVFPAIPGLDRFEGPKFHSSRWDASIPLDGKVVGVIGTGASAIQIVPELATRASKLFVFQRTPPWVVSKPDAQIAASTRAMFRRWPFIQALTRIALYWLIETLGLGFVLGPTVQRVREYFARRFLRRSVPDEALRARVTPRYAFGCKRVLFSNDWYPALLRPNVDLVTEPIRQIDGRAVVTDDGAAREVDALVCATGFEAADARVSFELTGRGGSTLDEVWKTDGVQAYLGTTVPGFPNFFFLVGPNTGLGHHSMIFMMESQYPYVLGAIELLASGKAWALAVKAGRAKAYNDRIQARLAKSVWNTGGCLSWYRRADGVNTTLWPGFTWEFRLRTRRFDVDAYETRGAA